MARATAPRLGIFALVVILTIPIVHATPTDGAHLAPLTSSMLNVYGTMGPLAPTFWGVNYDISKPQGAFANSTIATDLNATPIRFLRVDLMASNPSEANLSTFATWTHSQTEVTVDWNLTDTPAQDAAEVKNLEVNYSVHPAYWVLCNEPATKNVSGLTYARDVQTFIIDVRAFDAGAQFVGVETQVPNLQGAPYIYNVSKVDGPNLSAIAIHVYPTQGGNSSDTEQNFVSSIYSPRYDNNVAQGASLAWSTARSACPACTFKLFVGETNGNGQYRLGYDDVTYYAASVIQAWEQNISRFSPWALTASTIHNCGAGMIEVTGTCNGTGRTLNPAYYFFSGIASLLPLGTLYNASVTGSSHVYAAEDISGGTRWVLLANANLTNTVGVQLGTSFNGTNPTVSVYWMAPNQSLSVGTYSQNLTASPALSLGPMEVMVVKITTGGSPPPITPSGFPLGATSAEWYFTFALAVVAGIGIIARRPKSRRSG